MKIPSPSNLILLLHIFNIQFTKLLIFFFLHSKWYLKARYRFIYIPFKDFPISRKFTIFVEKSSKEQIKWKKGKKSLYFFPKILHWLSIYVLVGYHLIWFLLSVGDSQVKIIYWKLNFFSKTAETISMGLFNLKLIVNWLNLFLNFN